MTLGPAAGPVAGSGAPAIEGAGSLGASSPGPLRGETATEPGRLGWAPRYEAGPRSVVVPRPARGDHETLWMISLRELGSARYWPVLFELNAGREQPDGGRLDDPTYVRPGWIIDLPALGTLSGRRAPP